MSAAQTPPVEISDRYAAIMDALDQPPVQDRARRSVATMLAAAENLIDSGQIDRFTTADVARDAGVSIGLVYRYFPDRVAILDAVRPDRYGNHTPGDLREWFANALQDTVYICTRDWEGWQVGTMTVDDFTPAWEDDELLDQLVDAVTVGAVYPEVKAAALREAAAVISAGEWAEIVAVPPGTTGIAEAIAARDVALEDPEAWLIARADEILARGTETLPPIEADGERARREFPGRTDVLGAETAAVDNATRPWDPTDDAAHEHAWPHP